MERVATVTRNKTQQLMLPGENLTVSRSVHSGTYDLSVVIPTRNERDNIFPLLETLQRSLQGVSTEIIFVDDSDDDTPECIKDAAKRTDATQFHINLEHRLPGEARAGGLATAVVHGMQRAQAAYIAVLDADLQHPPDLLRQFYEQAITRDVDVVVASRYIKGGSYAGLANIGRRCTALGFKWLARLLFTEHLLRISDPMGGFFLIRRSLLNNVSLRPIGYKILMELLIRCQWRQALEVPYHFQARAHGQSKADIRQGILALQHMLRLWCEVPAAGRIWKIAFLLLFNLLMTVAVFTVNTFWPWMIANLTPIVFGILALVNFAVINRFIAPPPLEKREEEPFSPVSFRVSKKDADGSHPPSVDKTTTQTPKKKVRTTVKGKMYRRAPLIMAVVAVILATSWIGYALPGARLVPAILFCGTAIVFMKRVNREQAITMLLSVGVGVTTIDYILWRFAVTNWPGWWISIPLLLAETLGALHVLGFQFTIWPWSPPKIVYGEDPTQRPIFVFIPTVNEGVGIVRPTLEGVIAARDKYMARYPHGRINIVVCNDGRVAKVANWEEIDLLAQELGVQCVTRTQPGGAKAGNIENARQQVHATGDALVVIFDADQIAKPDFFLKTIQPFCDPKMGWVQTGQYYSNLDNPTSRWADDQQSMFYNLLCPGKAALNAAFICGTNVVIRATALDEIGGLPQNSVTEDFAASIVLHPSWRSTYLTDVLATGLGPLDVPSYLKQQNRWAMGTLSILRTHWRNIFLPQKGGLRFLQRIQYFLACTHYLCGLRDLIYLISPILFIFTGIPAVDGTMLEDYLAHFLPYILFSAAAMWYASRGITGLRGIIIGFGSLFVLIGSLLSAISGRKVGFVVTSKHHSGRRSLSYLWVYVVFFLLCVFCLFWITQVRGQHITSLFISGLWILYSIVMLGSFLWLNYQDIRFQKAANAAQTTIANQHYPAKLSTRRRGLGVIWNIGFAALLAVPTLSHTTLDSLLPATSSQAAPFVVAQEKNPAPSFGVSLPFQLVEQRPPEIERLLDTQLSIIGRTQEIHDLFDRSWADQLAARQTRPWITLEFGALDKDGQPPLDANFPAIINGLHDQNIERWARDIRNYGEPVYLTILLHADRDWSISSGVARGGIPQDIGKTWLHVQSIFREVGARNVAWVWAPADPIDDFVFAPPLAAIDIVLQSFIGYPDAPWGNPETVLQKLTRRYPTKPIIVEVSVNGPAAKKAAWLKQLGKAVNASSPLHALLYHEGGPELVPDADQLKQWSFASDPDALAAMRQVVADLHTNRRQ